MQWYTHDTSDSGNISVTVYDNRCTLQFRGQVMFTLLMDKGHNISIAPVLNYADHKSGQRYLAPPKFMNSLMGQLGIGSLFDQCCNQIYSGSTIPRTRKFMHLLFNAPHFSSI